MNRKERRKLQKLNKKNHAFPGNASSIDQANQFYDIGDLENAEIFCIKAIQENNENPIAFLILGLIAYRQGQHETAINMLEQSSKLAPNDPATQNSIGVVLKSTGKLEKARQSYDLAISLDPRFSPAYNNRGNLFLELRKFTQAEENFVKAIQLNPKYADAHSNLSQVFYLQEKFPEAEAASNNALKINPNNPVILCKAGEIQFAMGNIPQSLRLLKKAHARDPADAKSSNNLGAVLVEVGEFKEAERLFVRSLTSSPNYLDALTNLAKCLHLQTRYVEAIQVFEKIVQVDEKNSIVHTNLAILKFLENDFPSASRHLDKINEKTCSKLQDIKFCRTYKSYLSALVYFWQGTEPGVSPNSTNDTHAIAIGDSHAASLHGLVFENSQGKPLAIVSQIIIGCKAWHIANADKNKWKRTLTASFKKLKEGDYCFLTLGEIDCRPDEGIATYYNSSGVSKEEIINLTVSDCLGFVKGLIRKHAIKIIILAIPAPLQQLGGGIIGGNNHIQTVKAFNAKLAVECEKNNFQFLDTYQATTLPNESINPDCYIDRTHVKPTTYQTILIPKTL
ncbi:MAG: tetratricopeptide repeat protein [Amylibacter sp.]